jgi:hypothetical protein
VFVCFVFVVTVVVVVGGGVGRFSMFKQVVLVIGYAL